MLVNTATGDLGGLSYVLYVCLFLTCHVDVFSSIFKKQILFLYYLCPKQKHLRGNAM